MEKIVLRAVMQTNKYDMFVMHDQNRVLTDGEDFKPRKDLIESMKKDGFLETGHIVCQLRQDGKLEIIEGHNRFVTAKHLGLPVWFSAHPDSCKATPLKHSQTIKPWMVKDFAGAHAQETADYAEVMSFQRRTGIPHLACFALYGGMIASSTGNVNGPMKTGSYKIKNRDLPFAVSRVVEALGKHCDFAASMNLVTAISRAMFAEGFDVSRMLDRIGRKPELIKKCRTVSEYEAMLEAIYNHGVKSERLYLQAEIEKAMRRRDVTKRKA